MNLAALVFYFLLVAIIGDRGFLNSLKHPFDKDCELCMIDVRYKLTISCTRVGYDTIQIVMFSA